MKRNLLALVTVVALLFACLSTAAFAAQTPNNSKSVYKGTYLDLSFDSEDVVKKAAEGTNHEVKDGVLKITAPIEDNTTSWTVYTYELNVPETAVDMSKPFSYSIRFRSSYPSTDYIQFWSDITKSILPSSEQFFQLSYTGEFCVGLSTAAALPGTQVVDGKWHVADVLLTPKGAGKFEFKVHIDNILVYDSQGTENQNADLEAWFDANRLFNSNKISKFNISMGVDKRAGVSNPQKALFEIDYLRIGDGTLSPAGEGGGSNPGTADHSAIFATVAVAGLAVVVLASKKRAKKF